MLTETEFDNKIDISIDKRRIFVKSSNKRAKKILANNIFTGIVVLLVIAALVTLAVVNLTSGKTSFTNGTWDAVSDDELYGKGGSLISVLPKSNSDLDDFVATGRITLKGFFLGESGAMAAIVDMNGTTVSLEKNESVGGVTLADIDDGLVILAVGDNYAYLTLDEPTYDIQ